LNAIESDSGILEQRETGGHFQRGGRAESRADGDSSADIEVGTAERVTEALEFGGNAQGIVTP